ncbi:MAG: PAS domain S-box protein, partial [Anaerolineales bacterium]
MHFPISILTLGAVLTLLSFLSVLNFFFWRVHREDRTPLLLSGWLASGVAFALCRLLQYAPLSEGSYVLIARLLLTSAGAVTAFGYSLGNALVGYRPSRRELGLIVACMAVPVILLWTTPLILVDQAIARGSLFGGQFYGGSSGPLYLPAGLLILVVGVIAPIRLVRSSTPSDRQNYWIAIGYAAGILFTVIDFLAVAFNRNWARLSDYGFLPLAIFLTLTQVRHFTTLYRELDSAVQDRTAKLRETNDALRAEITQHQQAEQALRIGEEYYRMLFDSNPQPAWVYDLKTLAFLVVNDAAIARYGYSREEFLRMTIESIRPAEELPLLHENLSQPRLPLEWSGPWKHLKKDGAVITVEILSHELILGGHPARLVMANDITERIRTEMALQESEEKYRTVVESANDGITIIQNGRVRYVNPRLAAMRDEGIPAIMGQRFDTFIHPDHRDQIMQRYQRRLTGDHEPTTYETVLVRKDGAPVPVELTTGVIAFQEAPAELVIVRDISERKLSGQVLQRQLREMIVLNSVATAGAQATDVDVLIERVTNAVRVMLYPDNCGVLVTNEDRTGFRPHPSYHGTTSENRANTYPLSVGIAGRVISSGKPLRVDDIRLEPSYLQVTGGIQSEIGVPIFVNGSVFGCLNAESRELNTFTENDERLLNTIAESMSTAIEKIHLLQAEKRRREEAEILYNTTRDLVIERNLSRLLHII